MEGEEKEIDGKIKAFIKPFDLSKPPLMRVGLIHINDLRNILICDMHHIISDGISTAIFVKEFVRLYKGEALPNLEIQYKDFAVWQNDFMKSEMLKKQENYWINRFSDGIPVLQMPTDLHRPMVKSFDGDTYSIALASEDVMGLKKLIMETETTTYIVLLAIYNVLLAKYSGQEDIVIGSPVSGRTLPQLNNIIGVFVNTLPMRNFPSGDKSFLQFLAEVKENSLKAYENEDYPFEELINKLHIKRDASRNPIFDTVFVLQNDNVEDMEIETLNFLPYKLEDIPAKFDITLEAVEANESVTLKFEYCTKLFKKEAIERLGKDYLKILATVIQKPNINLKDISLQETFVKRDKAIKEEITFDF